MLASLAKKLGGHLYSAARHGPAGGDFIVMLHRVVASDQEASLPHRRALCLGAASFARLLDWLTARYDCVPLESLLAAPTNPRLAKPRVALTFDDGWRDNATIAGPMLAAAGVPASIFLSTGFVGRSNARFWWESIGEAVWQDRPGVRDLLPRRLSDLGLPPAPAALFGVSEGWNRSMALTGWLEGLKCSPATRLQQLADSMDPDSDPHAMDWAEVATLESGGLVRFGSHGHSHAILTLLTSEQVRKELKASREALDRHCQRPLPILCYPNGDSDQRIRDLTAEAGFVAALGTHAGSLKELRCRFDLPRLGIGQNHLADAGLLAWRIARGTR